MTTAIGIVITDHIVAGRLEDNRVTAERLRYPTDPDEPEANIDALAGIPPSDLVDMLAGQIAFLAKADPQPARRHRCRRSRHYPRRGRRRLAQPDPDQGNAPGPDLSKELANRGISRRFTSPTTLMPSLPASPPPMAALKS